MEKAGGRGRQVGMREKQVGKLPYEFVMSMVVMGKAGR